MKKRHFGILAVLALALTGSNLASADEPQPGVGRISFIQGNVSTQRGDSGDWVAATVNAPVVPGDRVSTGAGSRTEVQLDYANILRLDQQAEAKVADLTRSRVQIQVAQGLVNFDVLKGSEAEVEIDTPNVAVRPLGEGRYRIEVGSNSETRVAVREGQAEVSTPQGSTQVKKGELITIEGTDNPQYQIASAPGQDDWDNWNKDRDRIIGDPGSYQHANRYYTGVGDLNRYGRWQYVPGYDYVWAPNAGSGWAPYSDGSWVWEPYWGWTWVSYEPWGWAPYHYGRWFYWGNSWCWWPGPVYGGYRPLWAPAYVSFFGFGGGHWGFNFGFGFGNGFGFGSIGWLPTGPCDHFYPWWGHHGSSYNVVNVTNITNITNIRNVTNAGGIPPLAGSHRPVMSNLNSVMNNIHVRQGLTTVPANQFGRGRITAGRQVVTPGMLKEGQVVTGGLPVAPTRASLSPVNRPVNPAALPAHGNANQRFFTKTAPPAGPKPFTEEAAQVQRMIQQGPAPLAAQHGTGAGNVPASTGQARGPSTPSVTAPRAGTERTNNTPLNRVPQSGWRQFGNQPAPASAGVQGVPHGGTTGIATNPGGGTPAARSGIPQGRTPGPATAGAESNPSWQRFGDRSQPGTPAPRVPQRQNQAPSTAGQAQPRSSVSAQPGRHSWQGFSQANEARPASSQAQPRSSFSAQPGRPSWQGSSQANEARPASSGRAGSRSEPANAGWGRLFSRPETPAYSRPQGSYQRPTLDVRKPIVTERAPRSYESGGGRGGSGGGSRSSAPTGGGGSRGSSSSGSRSGGHGRR